MAAGSPRRQLFAASADDGRRNDPDDRDSDGSEPDRRAWRMSCAASPLRCRVRDQLYASASDFDADADSCSSSLQGLNFDSDSAESPSLTKFQKIEGSFASPFASRSEAESPPSALKTPSNACARESPPRVPGKRGLADRALAAGLPPAKRSKSETPKARLSLFGDGERSEIVSVESFYGGSTAASKVAKPAAFGSRLPAGSGNSRVGKSDERRRRRRGGEINFGVRHGIRKPKIDKRSSSVGRVGALGAALERLVENSPLNRYIEEFMKRERSPATSAGAVGDGSTVGRDVSDRRPRETDEAPKRSGRRSLPRDASVPEPPTVDFSVVPDRDDEAPSRKNNKFFKSSKSARRIVNLPGARLRVADGEICLSERPPERAGAIVGPNSESTSLRGDADISLDDDDDEMCYASEKATIENLLKQWGDDDDSIGERESADSGAAKSVRDSESLLRRTDGFVASEAEPDLRFVPENGGYVLTEDDPANVDCEDAPRDSDSIDSELAKLDEKIAELARLNDIDPRAFLSSDSVSFSAESPPPSDATDNLIYDEMENLENDPNVCNDSKVRNLFPVFNKRRVKTVRTKSRNVDDFTPDAKKFLSTSRNQYAIDAGQKKFGAAECKECGVIYQIGDSVDEADHLTYHDASDVLKFNGWKNERFCGRWGEGRAVVVLPGDPPAHWQRVYALLERVVHPQLGYASALCLDKKYKVYLYISKKKIVGCLVAEMLQRAGKIVSVNDVDCCSDALHPVRCGVSRIWTHKSHRRRGIATQLMNTMRVNFIFGHIMTSDEVAFSSPTVAGKAFAQKYTGIDDFYVYM